MRRDPLRRTGARAGAVLIIVLGLSMVLLGLSVSFMMRMRADSEETRLILAEAQARLMLHAGLMFLQEESRLGWGQETFGWTDVRDGSLGPSAIRDCKTGSATYGTIPIPSWWKTVTWGAYKPSPLDAELPPSGLRTWPCPGAVIRCPMAVPVQPPFATQLRYTYNPVGFPDGKPLYPNPGWDTAWVPGFTGIDPVLRNKLGATLPTASYWPISWATSIFDPDRGATAALDPQPQADLWYDASYVGNPGQKPDFIQGAVDKNAPVNGDWWNQVDRGNSAPTKRVQLQVKPGSDNLCWFRVYREVQADHDGDGVPAFDRVVMYDKKYPQLKNWNVFIVACGVGPTRGYRFWDAGEANDYETRNTLLPGTVTLGQEWAKDSGLFLSQQEFKEKVAQTRVLWFRAEWSALQGGGLVPENYSKAAAGMRIYSRAYSPTHQPATAAPYADAKVVMQPRPFPGYNARSTLGEFDEQNSDYIIMGGPGGGYADGLGYTAPKTYGGNFKWVQRLDHEPPNW